MSKEIRDRRPDVQKPHSHDFLTPEDIRYE